MDLTTLSSDAALGLAGQIGAVLAGVTVASTLVAWRCPAARKTLRNTLILFAISFLGLLATAGTEASLVSGIAYLLVGATVIRLAGLLLFRVIFGLFHIHPPSILEEILVVIAYFGWAMLQVSSVGVSLGEILTTSAIATAVLAFAMQDTLGNILGGLALQWDHSLKVGDWIRVGDVEGRIVDVKWRAISLETRNWETVVIPNGMMMKNEFMVLGQRTGQPTKWRRWIWFNIDYSVSPDRVIELAERAVKDADIRFVDQSPPPSCVLMEIDGSVARFALRYWLTNLADDDPTDSKVRQHLYAALNRQAIRLAIPRQHLYLTEKDEVYAERKHDAELQRRHAALADIALFRSLSEDELNTLAEGLEYRPYAEGDVIFRQGDLDHSLFLILAGQVGVYAEKDGQVSGRAYTLGPGQVLGEHGVMTGEARAATARAESALESFVLGKPAIAEILMNREEIVHEISTELVRRDIELQETRAAASGDETRPQLDAHELVKRIRRFMGL